MFDSVQWLVQELPVVVRTRILYFVVNTVVKVDQLMIGARGRPMAMAA